MRPWPEVVVSVARAGRQSGEAGSPVLVQSFTAFLQEAKEEVAGEP